ncbi:MAG TPA: hypothetical protein VM491_16690, partial [Burkholderiaceae bacterium]|nr:hypothetical protein [Burkholderiaceae bacterium]
MTRYTRPETRTNTGLARFLRFLPVHHFSLNLTVKRLPNGYRECGAATGVDALEGEMARLTDRAVQSLKAVGVERWVIDSGAHGAGRLVLRIRAAAAGGSKSFYFRYTNSSGKR